MTPEQGLQKHNLEQHERDNFHDDCEFCNLDYGRISFTDVIDIMVGRKSGVEWLDGPKK